jgi:hypothetical protein
VQCDGNQEHVTRSGQPVKEVLPQTGRRALASWGVASIVLFTIAFRVAHLDRLFRYDQEGTGAAYAVMARNYLRFGVFERAAVPILTVGHAPGAHPFVYPDHPPPFPC